MSSPKCLTGDEIRAVIEAASQVGQHRARDRALILLTCCYGLRVSEALSLKWKQVDLKVGEIHVNRRRSGVASRFLVGGDALRTLRQLRRENANMSFVFSTERGEPLTPSALNELVTRAGQLAGLSFPMNPQMIRRAVNYYFMAATLGMDTRTIKGRLGHSSTEITAMYTQ